MQRNVERRDGDSELSRQQGPRLALEVDSTDQVGVARREGGQHAGETAAQRRVPVTGEARGVGVGRNQLAFESGQPFLLRAAGAKVIRHRATENPVEPRDGALAAPQAAATLQRAQEARLQEIVGVGFVAHAPREKAAKRVTLRQQGSDGARGERDGLRRARRHAVGITRGVATSLELFSPGLGAIAWVGRTTCSPASSGRMVDSALSPDFLGRGPADPRKRFRRDFDGWGLYWETTVMDSPNDRDSLSDALQAWRVRPRSNPDFRPAVWQRITRYSRVSWATHLRAHRLAWTLATVVGLGVASWTGRAAAHAKVAADREAMVVSYLVNLDPRVQAKLRP